MGNGVGGFPDARSDHVGIGAKGAMAIGLAEMGLAQ